jgi:hypothetical protein
MKTFRLIAQTQNQENYNFDDPEGAPYWKFKGGSEYLVAELSLAQAQRGREYLENIVAAARPYIEVDNPMFRSELIDWTLLAPGELTGYERDQLEYEGRIAYRPTPVAELEARARAA